MSLRHSLYVCGGSRVGITFCGLRKSLSTEAKRTTFRVNPHIRDKRPIIQKQRKINEAHEKAAAELNLPWRIVGASILHRYPTITPDMPEWEKEFSALQEKLSALNRAALKERIGGTSADVIPDSDPSYDEIAKTLPFTPASRITPADEANDRRSPERKLANSLFLVVKRNREKCPWQFPQGKWLEGETLRQTAERINDRSVGEVRRWFVGNSPVGHYCYAYPKEMQLQRKQYGAKVFFYRAQLIEGSLKLETRLYKDYAWIARSEVGEYFDPDMAEYMTELLMD